jgi:hypothetical protein
MTPCEESFLFFPPDEDGSWQVFRSGWIRALHHTQALLTAKLASPDAFYLIQTEKQKEL